MRAEAPRPRSLTMVYDADGGLVGEVRYVVGHLIGSAECSLCDITHGPLRRKAAFDDLVARLEGAGHRIRVRHRNELEPDEAAAAAGNLPCVLARPTDAPSGSGGWHVLVTGDVLRRCEGDVAAFGAVLDEALAAADGMVG